MKYLLLESRLFEATDNSNQKPFHFTYSTQFLEISTSFILVFHNYIETRYFRINVASHQNKKGFVMSFNSLNSIVSLLSINSCVGNSTNLNESHRNETICALFFVDYSTRPCVETLKDITLKLAVRINWEKGMFCGGSKSASGYGPGGPNPL